LKLSGTHQLLVYGDDNILGGSIYTIRKNTEALLIAGMEVNAEKTKCMVMCRDQNAGQNSNMQIGNKFFEMVEQFKYLGTTLINKDSIHEEIKSRLKSAQNFFYYLLSKNVKIKIYITIILPIFLYGFETWSLTLREKCRLRVFSE
jgi:hypothetical protein